MTDVRQPVGPARRDSVKPLTRDRRPISVQLVDEVRAMIRDSLLRPGDQLPTEVELAARFDVARGSVREALKLLEREGLVDVRHGLGRFVSAIGGLSVHRPVTRFESVTEMLAAQGYHPAIRVLSAELGVADPTEADELQITEGDEVVRLRRIRVHEEQILIYSANSFPAGFLADSQLEPTEFAGSLAEWLDLRGRAPISSVARLQAATLPEDIALLPEAGNHREWLLVTEHCVDAEGRRCLYSLDYHRGDLFSFYVLRRRDD